MSKYKITKFPATCCIFNKCNFNFRYFSFIFKNIKKSCHILKKNKTRRNCLGNVK